MTATPTALWQNIEPEDSSSWRNPQSLKGDLEVDVVIVGGGYTGLWTAHALAEAAPTMSIAIVEARSFGFGASGRNGGWLSGKPVGNREVLAKVHGKDAVIALERRLRDEMLQIPKLMNDHGYNIHDSHGGWLQIARTKPELKRVESLVMESRDWALDSNRIEMLSSRELGTHISIPDAVGAAYSPDNIRIDPLRLVSALCRLVDKAGVQRFANTPATRIAPGQVHTSYGNISAKEIVVAVEGYHSALSNYKRRVLPLNSSMIATQPLPPQAWEKIGWENYEGISGAAHTYFYGQRTPDNRIVLGGRGKPYRFASGFDSNGEVDSTTVRLLESLVSELFPDVELFAEFSWCGLLGVTRDWSPVIHRDAQKHITEVAGFAGQGVTAAKVAGDTVANLIASNSRKKQEMPWVRPWPRSWEPEPFRWIGANGLYKAYSFADFLENRSKSGKTSNIAKVADFFAGR